MNQPRIAADWTSRKAYQEQYRKENREAINARKLEWRKARKEIQEQLRKSKVAHDFYTESLSRP